RRVVEIIATRDIRQWVEIEDRLAAAVEAILRNLVEHSAVTKTGGRIRRVAIPVEQRILDEDLVSVAGWCLREIPAALVQCRDANVVCAYRRKLLVPLLIPVEEELVLFPVEPAKRTEDLRRKIDRTAYVVAFIVVAVDVAW